MQKERSRTYDIAILGGGAAGMMAAIAAHRANPLLKILILEKNDQLGRKLLATGNGRCNFSNADQSLQNYRSNDPQIVRQVLQNFGLEQTLDFFQRLGLYSYCEESRYYPRSNQGKIVRELLKNEIDSYPLTQQLSTSVTEIEVLTQGFRLSSSNGPLGTARKLILCCGGAAAPQLGTSGDFYAWLRQNGHQIIEPVAALVPLQLKMDRLKKLAGIRFQAKVSLLADTQTAAQATGELLWTKYGISGIPTLQISRFAARALSEQKKVELQLDFLPEFEPQAVQNLVFDWLMQDAAQVTVSLSGLLHSDLAAYLVGKVEQQIGVIRFLHPGQAGYLASLLKGYTVGVSGCKEWSDAQTTCGGAVLTEVEPATMQSKKLRNLFLAGEVLDVDGNCGGYNLQWAWSSGFLAGRAAAGACQEQ
ncbi:MAG: aminoacetone oxidase family FAD-binding enzyme [Negativicutes bacterium]|nr:aminoacetone oxidase family FAD-binding enzyme [Negativicutes bacterium]